MGAQGMGSGGGGAGGGAKAQGMPPPQGMGPSMGMMGGGFGGTGGTGRMQNPWQNTGPSDEPRMSPEQFQQAQQATSYPSQRGYQFDGPAMPPWAARRFVRPGMGMLGMMGGGGPGPNLDQMQRMQQVAQAGQAAGQQFGTPFGAPPPAAQGAPMPSGMQPNQPAQDMSSTTQDYFRQNPDVAQAFQANNYGMGADQFAQQHFQKFGQGEGRVMQGQPTGMGQQFASFMQNGPWANK